MHPQALRPAPALFASPQFPVQMQLAGDSGFAATSQPGPRLHLHPAQPEFAILPQVTIRLLSSTSPPLPAMGEGPQCVPVQKNLPATGKKKKIWALEHACVFKPSRPLENQNVGSDLDDLVDLF